MEKGFSLFQMRPRISIRGCLRPSVGPSVRLSVRPFIRPPARPSVRPSVRNAFVKSEERKQLRRKKYGETRLICLICALASLWQDMSVGRSLRQNKWLSLYLYLFLSQGRIVGLWALFSDRQTLFPLFFRLSSLHFVFFTGFHLWVSPSAHLFVCLLMQINVLFPPYDSRIYFPLFSHFFLLLGSGLLRDDVH